MTEREVLTAADPQPTHHFWLLLGALAALLIGHPVSSARSATRRAAI